MSGAAAFTPDQIRLYPLTDERRGTGKPIKFRVGPTHALTSSDHVIHDDMGIAVFVPVASRQERVQWAIDKMRPTSLLDHLDVITELQHLILHRIVTEGREFPMFYFFQSLLLDSIHGTDHESRMVLAVEAVKIGKEIAFDTRKED